MWWRRSAENWEFDWVQVPENQAVPERSGRGGAGWVAGSGVGVLGFGPAGQTLCQLELREDVNPLVSGYSVLKDRDTIHHTAATPLNTLLLTIETVFVESLISLIILLCVRFWYN